jgi:tetratricopeptide (TPR) repeat protein
VSTVGLTPFVGRDTEIALLLERWAQVKDGSGHVVLLSGEAGIGKSRLIRAMKERLEEDVYIQLECRCLPYYQQSALYPVIELFHYVLQWHQEDTPDEKLKKLETVLTQYSVSLEQTVPLLAALLSLPHPDRYPPLQLTSQQQRQRTLGAILTLLLALTARQPVLLIVEDLHWLDPSTLELLTLIVEQTPTASICILLTFRPTFEVPWGNRSYVTQITLVRLPRPQVEQMVTHITGGKPFPGALLQQVVDQTDGVPLFVEECTKSILETGLLQETEDHYELTEPLPTLTIPTTLHDSLMARLDRLDTAKSIAQLGATIGRRVPYALLQAVWQQDEEVLQRELERLVEAELVYQRGLPPQAVYVFKHALIQETAYQSLLKRTREHYHQRIAQVLVEQFPETAALQPELLAHHYTEAGLGEQALPYWQQAGEFAVERSANAEAVSHFMKGLEILKNLPAMPEHTQWELNLQLALAPPLRMIKGHTAPEVEQAYTRAHELSQQVGDELQQFAALMSLWRLYLNRTQLRTARELAEQCLSLAQHVQDSRLLQEANFILGQTLLFQEEPVSARVHLERGIALYEARKGHSQVFSGGIDYGVSCLSCLAWVLWKLGYPDQALARSREALDLATAFSHPYTQGYAMQYKAFLHQSLREARRVQEWAEATIALAHEKEIVHWLAGGLFMRGWALAEQGFVEEGIEQLRQGMDAWETMGTNLGQTHMLFRLAEAYGRRGLVANSLRLLDEALVIMHDREERHFETEAYRLKGELLLQQEEVRRCAHAESPELSCLSEAEDCLLHALDLARRRQTKSLELRVAISLSRLWQQQGKRAEAHQMLEGIYSWFTEGFETPDLQEAKTLLHVL